jgi:hypothetical protein
MIFHTDAIQATDDAEIAEIHIEALAELDSAFWEQEGMRGPDGTIRDRIRRGFGDFAKIREKCLEFGVV